MRNISLNICSLPIIPVCFCSDICFCIYEVLCNKIRYNTNIIFYLLRRLGKVVLTSWGWYSKMITLLAHPNASLSLHCSIQMSIHQVRNLYSSILLTRADFLKQYLNISVLLSETLWCLVEYIYFILISVILFTHKKSYVVPDLIIFWKIDCYCYWFKNTSYLHKIPNH